MAGLRMVAPRGALAVALSLSSAVVASGAPHTATTTSVTTTRAVLAADIDVCQGLPESRAIRLHVVNEAGAPPEAMETAAREATAIWARAGVRVIFTYPPEPLRIRDGGVVLVMIRRALGATAPGGAAQTKGKVRRPLGWMTFDADDRPGSMMEVSLEATTALVARGVVMDKPMRQLPELARSELLGRGLGRVIAHELGHRLLGRGHAAAGLMKRSFNVHDLVERASPSLPERVSSCTRTTE